MTEHDDMAKALESTGYELFWFGSTTDDQIELLEKALASRLPDSFKRFLKSYGGGGVVGAEISGIEGNNAANDSGGTVLGDTKDSRQRYKLPPHLVVIYYHDDEVCWCLDTSRMSNNECPVVSYNIFKKEVDKEIESDFSTFFKKHLSLYKA